MWPNPTPMDHNLNKFDSTLSENASTQVLVFLHDRMDFEKKIFENADKLSIIPNYFPLEERMTLLTNLSLLY